MDLTNCNNGNHQLVEVLRANIGYGETHVARWCKVCGSVVVDGEYDGRPAPGNVLKMKSPAITTLNKG